MGLYQLTDAVYHGRCRVTIFIIYKFIRSCELSNLPNLLYFSAGWRAACSARPRWSWMMNNDQCPNCFGQKHLR